jgi:predicted CoA-substrate-specific enzyme activase
MNRESHAVLGIDIGSVSVGLVQMTTDRRIAHTGYAFHHGDIADTIAGLLSGFDLSRPMWVAASAATPETVRATARFDDQICCIAAARYWQPDVRTILNVGGEKFHLIRLGADGGYLGSRGSTSCAAGTGAFIDQQARRLNLAGAAELGRMALANRAPRPRIASRCAVFAKTDLIHAQQEGHGLNAICDGLCHGLVKNIADTVSWEVSLAQPLVFCGGVAQNGAVRRYLEERAGTAINVFDQPQLSGALGAGLEFIESRLKPGETLPPALAINAGADLLQTARRKQTYTYPPLTLVQSQYPDFNSLERYRHPSALEGGDGMMVEVDRYTPLSGTRDVYIGADIGSTSTKAVLMAPDGTVLAGFYTRTTGRPLAAMQRILESIDHLARHHGAELAVRGAGTTGSGRKFIGRIIGADLVLDEITAHARAACEIDPRVDTIIEIGGQDAKFTTLKDGRVTSATMNTVCAAGTGSFIEEQAAKLGCPLEDFSTRTEHRRAPLASDRCTVFMERDLNHYLSEDWNTDDVLASVLHSVRENYLLKVATESHIGDVIFFQGATAKNRALVAAFEQRLKKPILVSKYCHLTGALGAALVLRDEHRKTDGDAPATGFAGVDLWQRAVPVRSETCDLCPNHCKLSVATVGGEDVAYGFLCGRDYETRHFVRLGNGAFDLLAQHRKIFRFPGKAASKTRPTIGLPAGVHLVEDLLFWKVFFDRLGFQTVSSEGFKDAVRVGKPLTDAEFCAPIAALQGHVHYLKERCDYIFLPVYLEGRTDEHKVRRQYCYYTQYAPVLARLAPDSSGAKILSPLIRYLYTGFHTRMELYRMFSAMDGGRVTFIELAQAYDAARRFQAERQRQMTDRWQSHLRGRPDDVRIALLGRPYTLFSPALNGGIPGLFFRQGIDCCYQDMLDVSDADTRAIRPLLREIHWRYATQVLEAAQAAAKTPGLYPVLLTSFKCSPDAFIQDYFKQLMAAHDKPYLVLELDEHDSSVGYETRIEAAVRAFRNHHRAAARPRVPALRGLNPDLQRGKTDRTIVLPNWDRLTGRLLEAVLRREGRQAVLMAETETTIAKSLRDNTGQCIPINAMVEGFVECLGQHRLAPEDAALWMSDACLACNIALYPHHMKSLLNARGGGLEKSAVYVGDLFFKDVSPRASFNAVFAYMFGGLLRRVACRLRPYECRSGEVDRVLDTGLEILYESFLGRIKKPDALAAVLERFGKIPVQKERRPKVAVFGDLYSRDNRVMNQDLIRFIERHGGEVVTTPYSEYARMIASPYFRKWFYEHKFFTLVSNKVLMAAISRLERSHYRMFEPLLKEPMATFNDPPEAILGQYGVRIEHTGETLDNLLKVHYIIKHHPDVTLFVQASPAFCCPSLVTEAMARRIEEVTGVPVVPVTYDGTGGRKNDVIIPYLKYPRSVDRRSRRPMDRAG